MTPAKLSEAPLTAAIEGEQLVIRIGIDTLVMVAENCPLCSEDDEMTAPPYVKIVDKRALTEDVICELERGDETGMSPLMNLIDQAICEAQQGGSLAFQGGDDE